MSLGEQGRRWSQGTGGRQRHSLDLGRYKGIARPVWDVKSYEPIHISRRSLGVPIAPTRQGPSVSSPGSRLLLEPTPPCFHNMGPLCGHGFPGRLESSESQHRTRSALLCPGWLVWASHQYTESFQLSCLVSGPCVSGLKTPVFIPQLTGIIHEAHIHALHWLYHPPGQRNWAGEADQHWSPGRSWRSIWPRLAGQLAATTIWSSCLCGLRSGHFLAWFHEAPRLSLGWAHDQKENEGVRLKVLFPKASFPEKEPVPTYSSRALEKWKCLPLSHVQLFVTPWTEAHQAPPSMGFSRQEYWSGLPFPSPGNLLDLGIKSGSPTLWADSLLSELPGKLLITDKREHRCLYGLNQHPQWVWVWHIERTHFLFWAQHQMVWFL